MKFFLAQLLISIDQVFNTLVGGWADETLSAHAFRMKEQGKPWGFLCGVINVLLWDRRHCENSYLAEKQRLQSPPEERT